MKAHKKTFWPRALSLLLTLALLGGLLPAALAAHPEGWVKTDKLICEYKDGTPDEQGRILICGKIEGEGAVEEQRHQHVDTCYDSANDPDHTTPICGIPEVTPAVPGHTHDATCYHVHNDDCYEWIPPAEVRVTGITVSPKSSSIVQGDKLQLTAAVSPDNATNKTVTWESSNPSVASVDSKGMVTGNAAGSNVTITATTEDGNYKASSTITVTNPSAITVSISPSPITVTVGGTQRLTATVSNTSNTAVTWSSNKTNIATVDANGLVRGVAAGTAVITATTVDGGKTATCNVTVSNSSISLNTTSLNLAMNNNYTLKATTVPSSNASSVRWSVTSNSSLLNLSNTTGSSTTLTPRGTGTAVVTATSPDGKTASCTVYISRAASDITYTTSSGSPVDFDVDDFSNACSNATGRSLSYVKFSLPTSSQGTLYYNYTSNGGYDSTVSSGKEYYRSKSPYISYITFVPKSTYSGTCTITYTGVDTSNVQFTGQVVIKVSDSGDVTYTTAKDEPVALDNDSFDAFSRDRSRYDFDYVQFTSLPASSRGRLYYGYTSSGSYERQVSASTRYYRDSSYYLDEITFVPASGYTGTVSIPFTLVNSKGSSYSGTLSITVGSTGDISYTTDKNTAVALDEQDFIDYSKELTDSTFNYIQFTSLPTSSRGTLYLNYKSSSSSNTKVSTGTKYSRNTSPYLEDITFVPASGYTGTVSIPFTGYSSGGDRFSGTIKIYVGKEAGDVTYSAAIGKAVEFDASAFNTYCKEETNSNLDYVRFTLPASSRGVLYYDYSSSSSSNKKVSESTSYYRSGTPNLDRVTFVPAKNYSGTVSIPFTGKSTSGKAFSGTVIISYANANATVIRYTSDGTPVNLQVKDFSSACDARGGASLSSVQFTGLEYLSGYGTLYSGYASPASRGTRVSASTSYKVSGTPTLSGMVFVPKANFSGTVTLSYTGKDANNSTYTGSVEIVVSPLSASSTFADVNGTYSWAASSVDFLNQGGVVKGIDANHYGPAQQITRGDFVLMLYRAFGLRSAGSSSFPDVPTDSYYAEAIASAKALGIATGTGDGKFNPTAPLTRQDAMLLIQRTLNATGQTMANGSSSALNSFPDRDKVADYARGAVAAMVQAGIVKGDGNGNLNPTGSLTRAEMAAILHRVLTM